MARFGKKTSLKPSEVIEKAVGFFGNGGIGLKIVERADEIICFEGGGGHVTITLCLNEKTDVDLETREWDYQVIQFMREI